MSSVSISSAFDGGNIERVASTADDDPVQLKIRPDPFTELEQKSHSQWFSFRSLGPAETVAYEIVNAGEVSYPDAWPGSEVCVSTDRVTWTRIANTAYDAARGALCWTYDHAGAPGGDAYFAYFDPYSYERHLDLVARCAAAPGARVRSLGATLDGRLLECVECGSGPLHVWAIHRQHPGESQAEWYAEGLLTRLLGLGASAGAPAAPDALAVRLLKQFTFHVVPNMNPDGSVRGHLRVNAGGQNLNREWASTGDYEAPTLHRSPEVYHVLAAMDASGCDAFVDVHGDEELPFTFVAGAEGCAVWGPRQKALQSAFVGAYGRANPDMQAQFGYEADKPLAANLAVCSNQIAQRFDCVALTLEMPFKDNAPCYSSTSSFQGARCAALGGSLLDALAYVGADLRGVAEPSFPRADDQYVAPVEDATWKAFAAAQKAAAQKAAALA